MSTLNTCEKIQFIFASQNSRCSILSKSGNNVFPKFWLQKETFLEDDKIHL